jgi:hypothetical protein
MLPTKSNHTKDGCVTTSSNCVIWQGPDISCIKLCKGDTVSDVVAKLALELCEVLEFVNISTYDLSCLDLAVEPTTFDQLIQLIITRICNLQSQIDNIETGGSGGGSSSVCPDNCVITLPTCLRYEDQSTGNIVEDSNLTNLVQLIANKICDIVNDINIINSTIIQHSTDIENLQQSVEDLENSTIDAILPDVNINCINGQNETPINTAVEEIAETVCEIISSVGENQEVLTSLLTQCVGLDTSPKLTGTGLMQNIPGWFKPATNIAESLSNLWLTICDMRSAIQNIQTNCCSGLCESIDITMTVSLTTTININFIGSIPVGFSECNPLGTSFTIVGDGYSGTFTIPILSYINNTYNLPIPSGLNTAANFTISSVVCLQQAESTCEKYLQYTYESTVGCPVVTLSADDNTIDWSFANVVGGSIIYIVELFNSTGTTLLESTTITNPAIGSLNGTFSSETITSGTSYLVRIRYSINSGSTYTTCNTNSVTTTIPTCASIDSISPTPTITFTTT